MHSKKGYMNWEAEIDIYTLICITNKNLLYTKINKIQKFKKRRKKGILCNCRMPCSTNISKVKFFDSVAQIFCLR